MNQLTVGVIFGGQSSEYSISLHSAASLLREINREKYNVVMIGISETGGFYLYEGSIDDMEHDHWVKQGVKCAWVPGGILPLDGRQQISLDCAFPVLHGKNGEDGSIQGLLELMNIHYVGCDVLSSAISMDKEMMHILCKEGGVPCADYVCLKENQDNPTFEEIKDQIPLPWIVKPCSAGSSYGVHKVENKEEFENAIKDAWHYDGRGKCLVEKAIDGFEIGCAVMGNKVVKTGSCDEIEITRGFFDFEGKYALDGAQIHCPARIDKEVFEQAQELAKKTYRVMNCLGMARVDMFVQKDNSIVLNELNTIPGFTATSRYPSMMKEVGLDFSELIDQLIELAMERELGVC